MILKRLDDAERDGDRIYAVIQGLGAAGGGGVDAAVPEVQTYRTALKRASADAGVEPGTISYLETHGSGHPEEDAMEAAALVELTRASPEAPPCALGSVKADIGHAGAAAGLASLVKTALCLYQEVLPPLRNVSRARPELDDFYLPSGPQHWLRDRARGPRRAAVTSFSVDGNVLHVVLEGHESATETRPDRLQPLGAQREALLVIEADAVTGLLEGLERLRGQAERSRAIPVESLARDWWQAHPNQPRRKLGIALVARTTDELLEQTTLACQWLEGRQKPAGDRIFFAAHSLGADARVAFVFPGSGNHFADMGRELGLHWPEVLRRQDRERASCAANSCRRSSGAWPRWSRSGTRRPSVRPAGGRHPGQRSDPRMGHPAERGHRLQPGRDGGTVRPACLDRPR